MSEASYPLNEQEIVFNKPNLRQRCDSDRSTKSAISVRSLNSPEKSKQAKKAKQKKKVEKIQEAKSQYLHRWLINQSQGDKVQSQSATCGQPFNEEHSKNTFEIQLSVNTAVAPEGSIKAPGKEVCKNILTGSEEASTSRKENRMAANIHDHDTEGNDAEPPMLVPLTIESVNHDNMPRQGEEEEKEQHDEIQEQQAASDKEPKSPVKADQRMEHMIATYRERYEKKEEAVLFEMFENALRRVLNIQKTVVEIKRSQTTLSSKIDEIQQVAHREVSGVSSQVTQVSAEKDKLSAKVDSIEEQIKEVEKGVFTNEVKLDSYIKKTDVIDSQMQKGCMILKNLEEKEEDPKLQVDTFIKEKLKISEGLDIISAFRMGKPDSSKIRPIKFKLLDPNEVSLIYSNLPNLKGVKNENNDKYIISEVLTEKDTEQKRRLTDLKAENRKLPVPYQAEIKMKKNNITVNDKPLKQLRTPTLKETLGLTTKEVAEIRPIKLWQGDAQEVETSVFTGYVMETESFEVLKDAYKYLRNQHLSAAHIMCGYRFFGKDFATLQNYSDDGEIGGGRAVLSILKEEKVFNTAIFVIRYRDHKNIGSKRFDAIRDAARSALAKMTVVSNRGQAEADQVLVKALNDAVPPAKPRYQPSGIRGARGGRNYAKETPKRGVTTRAAAAQKL